MFLTGMSRAQAAARRIAIYVSCLSGIFLAAFIFCVHDSLQTPSVVPAERGKSGLAAQIQPRLIASYGKLPLSFEANQGQAGAAGFSYQ